MIAHLCAVLQVEQSLGENAVRLEVEKVITAVGTTWETQDPWQMPSCVACKGIMDDPFDASPQVLISGGQHQHLALAKTAGNTA